MKIRVIVDKYEHQGLYKGSEHEAVYHEETHSYNFKNYGKLWALDVLEAIEVDLLEESDFPSPNEKLMDVINTDLKKEEYTGKSVDYYKVKVDNPTTESNTPYLAECNDLIEALGMNYAEGNAFKAIWRKCAARKFGVKKKGYDNGLYDSEKVVFFGERMVEQSKEQK